MHGGAYTKQKCKTQWSRRRIVGGGRPGDRGKTENHTHTPGRWYGAWGIGWYGNLKPERRICEASLSFCVWDRLLGERCPAQAPANRPVPIHAPRANRTVATTECQQSTSRSAFPDRSAEIYITIPVRPVHLGRAVGRGGGGVRDPGRGGWTTLPEQAIG